MNVDDQVIKRNTYISKSESNNDEKITCRIKKKVALSHFAFYLKSLRERERERMFDEQERKRMFAMNNVNFRDAIVKNGTNG